MASSFTRIALVSTGVLSLAVVMKVLAPFIPVIYDTVMVWMKPPYLYVIINGIIITIAASSRFTTANHNREAVPETHSQPLITVRTPPPSDLVAVAAEEFTANYGASVVSTTDGAVIFSSEEFTDKPVVVVHGEEVVAVENEAKGVAFVEEDVVVKDDVDEVLISTSSTTSTNEAPERSVAQPEEAEIQSLPDIVFPVSEKPLVSSRFNNHRKPIKTTPEGGRALRVARPKRHHETLESTWKMITEGRHVPLTRHLANHHHHHQVSPSTPDQINNSPNSQSPTLTDRTNNYSNDGSTMKSAARIRKEPSLTHDELNRRAEAFIKKFNEEMRIQRQQSLQQYMEMVNRGTH